MDKLLANERVLRAVLNQAQNQLGTAVFSGPLGFDEGNDWLLVKEEINKVMQDLVIATAVVEELWRTEVYRKAHSVEDPIR
jgi:hypothetical protein